MAMMAKMRSLAPAFIITIGGIFVLFMVLSDSRVIEIFGQKRNSVGSINGEEITYSQFNQALDQFKQKQKEQSGKDIDEENLDGVNDQVWDALVTEKLIKEQYQKLGISVSDQEVTDILFGTNPPEALKRQFTDSLGRFNRQLYESTLLNQKKEVLVNIEDFVKQNRLQEKLQNYLFATINVTEGEIKRRFMDQTIKMKGEYVLVDVNAFGDNEVSVTDADLEKYYKENMNKYKVEAQRKLKYVLFSKTASKDDSATIKSNLTALAAKAKDDTASFQSYVKIYSDQPYSKDTVKQSMLPAAVAGMLANAVSGSLVGPVDAFEGYVVYKLVAKVPSDNSYVVEKIVNKIKASAATSDNAYNSANDFSYLSKKGDFEQEAKLLNYKVSETVPFIKESYGIPGIGANKALIDWAFENSANDISETFKGANGYVVVKISGVIKPGVRSFEEVKASVRPLAIREKKFEKAKQIADKLVKQVASGQLLNVIATSSKYAKSDTTGDFSAQQPPTGTGRDFAFIDKAMTADINKVTEPVKGQRGYYLIKIASRTSFDKTVYSMQRNFLRDNILQEKKSYFFGQWIGQLRKDAKIVDNRRSFYR
ncbi:MAG: SurA N-terminal domain-containing protein [Ignavibacteria bacterium]